MREYILNVKRSLEMFFDVDGNFCNDKEQLRECLEYTRSAETMCDSLGMNSILSEVLSNMIHYLEEDKNIKGVPDDDYLTCEGVSSLVKNTITAINELWEENPEYCKTF